jgi:hypothetical protein
MSRTRNDSASFNINVTVPPVIVREFFDGLSKVESAKHPPQSEGVDWSSVLTGLASFAPIALQLLSSSVGESDEEVRKPSKLSRPTVVRQKDEKDGFKDVVVKFVQTTSDKKTECCESEKECKEKVCDPYETNCTDDLQCDDVCKNTCEGVCEVPKEKKDASEKKSETPSVKWTPPKYMDAEPIEIDLNSFGKGGGIADMMKMFMPMMQGLVGGLNGTGETSKESAKSEPEKVETISEEKEEKEEKEKESEETQ